MSAVQTLHVLEHIVDIKSDLFAVQLRIACEHLHTPRVHEPPAPSEPRFRYNAQQAETYQEHLAAELQQHWLPHIQQQLNVDALAVKLVTCVKYAAHKHHAW